MDTNFVYNILIVIEILRNWMIEQNIMISSLKVLVIFYSKIFILEAIGT